MEKKKRGPGRPRKVPIEEPTPDIPIAIIQPKKACGECAFFSFPDPEAGLGFCHFNPKTIQKTATEWCGQFQWLRNPNN